MLCVAFFWWCSGRICSVPSLLHALCCLPLLLQCLWFCLFGDRVLLCSVVDVCLGFRVPISTLLSSGRLEGILRIS